MIPKEQPEEMIQVREPVVHRRRGDEQHAGADDEGGERPITAGVGVPEAVGLVHYPESDAPTVGRSDRAGTQEFVRDDPGFEPEPLEQGTPLRDEDRGHHEGERLGAAGGHG